MSLKTAICDVQALKLPYQNTTEESELNIWELEALRPFASGLPY